MPSRIGPEGRAALLLVKSLLEGHRTQRAAICAAVIGALAPFTLRAASPPTAWRTSAPMVVPRPTPIAASLRRAPLPQALRRIAPIVTLVAQAFAVS